MIQEKAPTATSGDSKNPDKAAAQATKPRNTARKTSPKTPPAEKAASSTANKKTVDKKPRATTQKPTVGSAVKSAEQPTKSKTAPAEPAGAISQKATAAPEKKQVPAKAKTPAKPRRTAVPKNEVAKNTAGTLAKDAAPQAVASSLKNTETVPEAKHKSSRPRLQKAPTSVEQKQKAQPTPETQKPLPAPTAKEAAAPQAAEQIAPHNTGTTENSTVEGARPASSRRSRRGGRRRNKGRSATAENGTPHVSAPETDQQLETTAATLDADTLETSEKDTVKEAKEQERNIKQSKKGDGKTERETESNVKGQSAKGAPRKCKMFISVLSGELVEVVLAEEGQVLEYYVEMQHQAKVKGNIYKGVVSNIDANLQAAFISYAGGVKNGFLQIDEVHPEYYQAPHDQGKSRKHPPIQKVLKPGQEILVQVVKEPAGTKGAFLTSYLSLPGRFLVLTPGREQIGVSRKVDSDEERTRLRGMLEGLTPGKGLGVIVRTVSEGAGKTNLQRDLQFLKRLWKEVRTKGQTTTAPSLIYEELDLSTRAIRDYLTDDVEEVWVDDAATAKQVTELAALLFPKKQNLVQVHSESGHTLFERFSLQKQLDQIHSREVALPSGGRLVIDNTEALTAIDINSGRSSGKSNFEDMAFRTNLEAAKAIPLQLRLRDIGGQVVVDFIEMRDRDHWREVEKAVRNGMKGDRARYDVGKIGPFGLLEIVRQRLGSSAISISTEPCPCCKGTGIRRNMEWQSMRSLRDISKQLRQAAANNHPAMTYEAEPELAFYLLNAKRVLLYNMEEESGVSLTIRPTAG